MTIGEQVVAIIGKRFGAYESQSKRMRQLAGALYRRVIRVVSRRQRGALIGVPDRERAERRQHHRWGDTHYCRRCGVSAKRAHARALDCRMVQVRAGNAARKRRRGYR